MYMSPGDFIMYLYRSTVHCCLQAEVFEEIATIDYPFEGIPTIPPRKNTTHMAAFCNGCRYRVTANPDMTVAEVSCSALP